MARCDTYSRCPRNSLNLNRYIGRVSRHLDTASSGLGAGYDALKYCVDPGKVVHVLEEHYQVSRASCGAPTGHLDQVLQTSSGMLDYKLEIADTLSPKSVTRPATGLQCSLCHLLDVPLNDFSRCISGCLTRQVEHVSQPHSRGQHMIIVENYVESAAFAAGSSSINCGRERTARDTCDVLHRCHRRQNRNVESARCMNCTPSRDVYIRSTQACWS